MEEQLVSEMGNKFQIVCPKQRILCCLMLVLQK